MAVRVADDVKASSSALSSLDLGKVICNLRRDRRMTQPELARELGCSRQTVSMLETGRSYPSSVWMLRSVARFIGVTTDAIIAAAPKRGH
jgi:DNA-binding XRE family transcriptional regulator